MNHLLGYVIMTIVFTILIFKCCVITGALLQKYPFGTTDRLFWVRYLPALTVFGGLIIVGEAFLRINA